MFSDFPDFPIQNYQIVKKIGDGSFASVHLIKENGTQNQNVAKIYKSKCDDKEGIINFIKEVNTFSKVKYPTILNFIGYSYKNFDSEPYPMILTEYISNTSLQSMLYNDIHSQAPVEWSDTSRYIVLFGLALGLNYLQSQQIIHCDIKPDNILLSDKYYPKICDFGLSKIFFGNSTKCTMKSMNGTPFYMAPEIQKCKEYTYKADVYSFSLVAYQTITCQLAPFEFDTNSSKIFGDENKKFLEKCHSEDPSERPTIYEICCYIAQKNFINVFNQINYDDVLSFLEYLNEKEDDSDSLYFSGLFLLQSEKYKSDALDYFKKSADLGNSDAMLKCAQLIYENDKNSAFDYYRKAADKGNAEAMFNVYLMLDKGDGVKMDKYLALYYMYIAEEEGYKIPQIPAQKSPQKNHKKARTKDSDCNESKSLKRCSRRGSNMKAISQRPKAHKCLVDLTIPRKEYDKSTKPEKTYSFEEAINLFSMKITQDLIESRQIQKNGQEFIDRDRINYNLYEDNSTGEVSYSPKSKGDVFIKTYVDYQMNEYNITRIGNNAFSNTSIESLSFAENSFVKSFGQSPFSNSSLSCLCIPPNLDELDWTVFKDTKQLNEIEIDPNNKNFSDDKNGCVYYKKNKLIFMKRCFNGNFVANDRIATIGSYAFSNVDNLYSFSSKFSRLAKICPYSFYQCKNLKTVSIETNELEIGSFGFSESENLSSIEFKSMQKLKIAKNCFEKCPKLSKISFSKIDKISIGSEAFNGCVDLYNFMINEASLIILDEYCFVGANNLNSLTLISDLIIFSNSRIRSISLTDISIQTKQNISVDSKTFENCTSLKNLSISSSSKISVFTNAFANNFCLNKVIFECDSVSIQKESFVNCNSFNSFSLKAKEEIVIHENVFVGCSNLIDFVVDSSSSLFIYNKFAKSSIKTVCLSAKSITIDNSCFSNCSRLVDFKLNAFNSIVLGSDQFSCCKSLNRISIDFGKAPNSQIKFGLNCFSDAKMLNEIYLSATGVEISNYTMNGIKSMKFCSVNNKNIFNNL